MGLIVNLIRRLSQVLRLVVSLIRRLAVSQLLRNLLSRFPTHLRQTRLQKTHLQQTHLPAHFLSFRLLLRSSPPLLLSSSTNKPHGDRVESATPQFWGTRRPLPLNTTLLGLGAQGARDLAVVRHPVQPPRVDNFVSAGATASNVRVLYRFEMP